MQNPFLRIGKFISGSAVDALQDVDECDVLRGLTADVVDTIADRYKFVAKIVNDQLEFTLEKKAP